MRNRNIDIMRGIGISLVGLEHCIVKQYGFAESITKPYYTAPIGFLIHIFFAISGYLVYGKVSQKDWIRKHSLKWILPVIVFSILYWVFGLVKPEWINLEGLYNLSFIDYTYHILTTGFSGIVIWFLWALILCYMLAWFLEYGRLHIKIPLIIQFAIIIIFANLLLPDVLGLFTVKWYGIFFLTGYIIKHYENTKIVAIGKKYSFVSLFLLPLFAYIFNWMLPYQNNYANIGLAFPKLAIINGHGLDVLITLFYALLGIYAVYSLSKLIRLKYISSVFAYLGSITIGIYLIRVMFVGIADNIWLALIISTIISIAIYELLKRVPFLNQVLFGSDFMVIPINIQKTRGLV